MKKLSLAFLAVLFVFSACVPKRQLEELQEKHDQALTDKEALSETLASYRDHNAQLNEQLTTLSARVERLEEDTLHLGRQLRRLSETHEEYVAQAEAVMEGKTEETRQILARMQEIQEDLQRREDELEVATREMEAKEQELRRLMAEVQEKEVRVDELEEILQRQDSIVQELRQTLSDALIGFLDDGLTVDIQGGRVYVSMEESLLFETGSTTVDAQGVNALRELARVLADNPDIHIMIEGHTDDVPFRPGAAIKDNWELSVLRATAVLRILLEHGDIDPARFIAAGRGEHHPIDPDDTPEARRKNRRTEIILTPELDELFQILEH